MGVSLSIIAIFGMILGGLGVTIWGSVKHDRKYDGGYNNNNSTGGYGNYTTNANATGVDFGLSDIAFGGGTQGQGGKHSMPDWQIGVIVGCVIAVVAVVITAAVVVHRRRKAKKIEEEKKKMEAKEKEVGDDEVVEAV